MIFMDMDLQWIDIPKTTIVTLGYSSSSFEESDQQLTIK